MEQLGINPIFLLSQIVNFAVLAFLLRRFAYKPILNMLDKRRERIEKGLDEQRQMRLVQEFFSGIKAGEMAVAKKAGDLTGEKAVVTSALPLSEADQATYRTYLQDQLGEDATVEFKTDPALLGGVVLRVGDVVVDGSVAGSLGALRQSLG